MTSAELQDSDTNASAPSQEAQGERRERRSRDRYGRDRRDARGDARGDAREGGEPRQDQAPPSDSAAVDNAAASAATAYNDSPAEASEAAPRTRSYFDRSSAAAPAPAESVAGDSSAPVAATPAPVVSEAVAPAAPTPVPAAPGAPAAPTATPTTAPAAAAAATAAPAGLPRVQSYELPLPQLQAIASGSGLEWVNSDADKVAAVQAVIAAEPRPVHVPRERPPAVVIDEGPLVLVETRRDLAEMKLPF